MNQIMRFYDLTAEGYAVEFYSNEIMLPSLKEYIDIIGIKNPRILDLGCGPGQESMRLKRLGAEVVGIDFSSEAIKIAIEKNPDIPFFEKDFFLINKDIGLFDGILACSSLIHLNKQEYSELLGIIDQVIKPQGWFLNIFRQGKGQLIQNPEVKGEKLIRTIELYEDEEMKRVFEEHGYIFIKKGFLDTTISGPWASLIFRKN